MVTPVHSHVTYFVLRPAVGTFAAPLMGCNQYGLSPLQNRIYHDTWPELGLPVHIFLDVAEYLLNDSSLYRSLAKALYNDGRIVSETNEQANSNFYTNFGGITENDTSTGYIYILKSHSKEPKIQSLEHLYKIGFSTTTVEKRIANAKKEPTYLMADVEVIAEYQAFNINPQKFEYYLHAFFGEACLDLLVADKGGKNHQPKEWFIAPLNVIQQAVELLVNSQIMNYKYNKLTKEIELK
nr:GIY-YIG nuclease family protein [Acinetobacter baumannii]